MPFGLCRLCFYAAPTGADESRVPSTSHGWLAVGHNMPPAKAGFRVPFIVILALTLGGEGGSRRRFHQTAWVE